MGKEGWQVISGLCAVAVAFISLPAQATMPTLSPLPKPAMPSTCHSWATAQSGDAMEMWGIEDSGASPFNSQL